MLSIKEVLSEEELTVIRDYLSEADFVDGKHSAGELIKHRKDNLQLSKQAEGIDLLNKVIIDALSNNALFCNWVQPMRYTQPLHARYEKG